MNFLVFTSLNDFWLQTNTSHFQSFSIPNKTMFKFTCFYSIFFQNCSSVQQFFTLVPEKNPFSILDATFFLPVTFFALVEFFMISEILVSMHYFCGFFTPKKLVHLLHHTKYTTLQPRTLDVPVHFAYWPTDFARFFTM